MLVSNDVENRRIATDEMSLNSLSVRNYIETFRDSAGLIDKLSSHSSDDKAEKVFGKELYSPHRTPVEINAGIKAGKLLQGVFYLSRTNFKEASVSCEAYEQPILIKGKDVYRVGATIRLMQCHHILNENMNADNRDYVF